MKHKITYKWPCICLLLIMCLHHAQAQFPKLLKNYPVVLGTGGINALAQKGNTVYMGGDFASLGAEPLLYGIAFNQIGASTPNPNFVMPNGAVVKSMPDGNGGFYISGTFTSVGGVARTGAARVNADGSLNNDWNPVITGAQFSVAGLVGNAVIVFGNFTNIGSQAFPTGQKITALDATTGQPLPGWSNLVIPGITNGAIVKVIVNGNKIYVLARAIATGANGGATLVKMIDISDINNPALSTTFQLDAVKNSGTTIPLLDIAASGNTVYLSGWDFTSATVRSYTAKTVSSNQSFNSSLFSIDGTTGAFKQAFTTPVAATDIVESLAIDGNSIYLAYHTGNTGKLAAFDLATGNDITNTTLPVLTMTNTVAPTINANTKIPTANISQIFINSTHQLILFGNGFATLNGNNQSTAVVDLLAKSISSWNPVVYTPVGGSTTIAAPTTIAESNGKLFFGGTIGVPQGTTYFRKGLAALNLLTGEVQPWTPVDFTGVIKSITISNNTLYVGGSFTGSNINLAAYDITDPNNPVLISGFTPNPDGVINALAVNNNKLFVGGDFQNISGSQRGRLASFDLSGATATLNPSWNPGANDMVNIFTIQDDILYTGGAFSMIGSSTRNYVASFDFNGSGNGTLTNWDPKIESSLGNQVNALAAQSADGTNHNSRIFIGGSFLNFGTAPTAVQNLAVANSTDGSPDAWQLPGGVSVYPVYALAKSNNELYIGGHNFFNSADVSGNFAAIDPTNYLYSTGQTVFGNNVYSILPSTGQLIIGGDLQTNGAAPVLNDPNLIGLVVLQTELLQAKITFADVTKIYGDADAPLVTTSNNATTPITYALSEQKDVNGSAATIAEITAEGKLHILMPGTAKITASQIASADYIAAPDVAVILTINKAQLTIHPQNSSAVVNQPLADFPFTLTGWIGSDATKAGIVTGKPTFASTATTGSPVGTYNLSVGDAGTLASDFYTFTPSADIATLTINATGSTPQTITFAALPAKTYGDADLTLSGTTDASGLSVMYKSSDDNIATITGNKLHLAGAGTVTITASQAGDPIYAPATDVPQTLTITQAALTIKADNKTINRGDQLPAFTATYTGLVNGDAATDLDTPPAFSTTATQASAPGTYPISAAGAASDNYNITYVNGTLTIKGTQIITFTPVSTLTYGDAPFNPGATSDAGASFTPVYTTSNPSVIAISGGQAVIKGAGTATITATFAAANGFELTTATEQITVQPKALTVTADNKTKNYGDPLPALTVTYNGFVNNDTYTTPGVFNTPAVAATTATATSPAGTYPITPSGATSNNYTITFLPGTLTISNLNRTLTFNAIPAKTYGDPDFDGAILSSGEQVVYTFSNPSVATTINGKIHITGAGSTDITASAPANSNYNNVNPATQTLTVAKAPLIITADNKTKSQGPPDILLTATYSGFVGNDNQLGLTTRPVLTTTANANSPIGTYPITVSGASSPNYDITYQNATLTIILAVGQDEVVVSSQALSPDGDGVNDYFNIGGINNFPTNHVTIINRNGVQVWETSGYDNISHKFDGHTTTGNQLQQGTYYFLINYSVNGQQKKKSGYLILKY